VRIDGRTDTPEGKEFHQRDKPALSMALHLLLAATQKKGVLGGFARRMIVNQANTYVRKMILRPEWAKGDDVLMDPSTQSFLAFIRDFREEFKNDPISIDVDPILLYAALLFHNDEFWRERIGWGIEWFGLRYRVDMTDGEVLALLDDFTSEWDKVDMRQNRKVHIRMALGVLRGLFEQDGQVRTRIRYSLLWWKHPPMWTHELWFDPMRWYPRMRGALHYGVHGGVM
jgi:hypothetical protein